MRVKIREAIYRAADERSGYKTIGHNTGFAIYMQNGSVKLQLPCLWLCPLEMTATQGGKRTYAGVMYLMETVIGLSSEAKDEAWDRMEGAALRILNAAAESNDILSIENIRCAPDEYALTGYQTISVVVHFEVKVSPCEDRE